MLIYVTNRKLLKKNEDFLERIELLAKGKPDAIMLREKDLPLNEYEALAIQVKQICESQQVPLIINQNLSVALKLQLENIHLSMPNLRDNQHNLKPFKQIGASVHSVDEAKEAVQLGATYLIAGHIFSTDCKKGVPPRGLPFLKEVCKTASPTPVFAIGGITTENQNAITKTGATGICIMSAAMTGVRPPLL